MIKRCILIVLPLLPRFAYPVEEKHQLHWLTRS